MATRSLLIVLLPKPSLVGTGPLSLYGELLAVAGGKERMRFYLNKYRPDFADPNNPDEFIAQLHAAKTVHYQQLVASGAIPLRRAREAIGTRGT